MLSHVNLFFPLPFPFSHGLREENNQAEEEMDSEKEEEDSEEETESSTRLKEAPSVLAAASATPALTKAEARELRRVRKLDHSWLTGLLDS